MPHILVVDDEPDIRYAIVRAIESLGHTVTEAAGRSEAAAILSRRPVDLLICDLQLPDLAAIDIIKQARRQNVAMAIVLVTGDGLTNSAPYADRARLLDVSAILRKPFDYDALSDLVNRLTSPYSAMPPGSALHAG